MTDTDNRKNTFTYTHIHNIATHKSLDWLTVSGGGGCDGFFLSRSIHVHCYWLLCFASLRHSCLYVHIIYVRCSRVCEWVSELVRAQMCVLNSFVLVCLILTTFYSAETSLPTLKTCNNFLIFCQPTHVAAVAGRHNTVALCCVVYVKAFFFRFECVACDDDI